MLKKDESLSLADNWFPLDEVELIVLEDKLELSWQMRSFLGALTLGLTVNNFLPEISWYNSSLGESKRNDSIPFLNNYCPLIVSLS